MNADAEYLERIREAYHGELYGEAVFATLASRARSAERRDKWLALAQLEFETGRRLLSVLEQLGADSTPAPDTHRQAEREASVFASLRWHDAMDLLHAQVTPFIARLEALERLAPLADRPLLARITAHEVALQSFARLELAGRPGESIGPALALLDSPPAQVVPIAAAC